MAIGEVLVSSIDQEFGVILAEVDPERCMEQPWLWNDFQI